MIYTCELCLYTFNEGEGCSQCPDCGKRKVRAATEKEELEYYRNKKEFTTEIKRFVLVAVPYSEKPAWYLDEEDSEFVVFHLDFTSRQSTKRSGTMIAYQYAQRQSKIIELL